MSTGASVASSSGAPERIDSLDAARGPAVSGIVLLNVYNFSMPPAAYFNPLGYGYTEPETLVVWAVESILAQDAFRAIFAILFGAGVAILFERGSTVRGHVARILVLLTLGYLHLVLLNNGDVLRRYALTGLRLPLLLRLSQRGLLIAVAVLASLHMVGLAGLCGVRCVIGGISRTAWATLRRLRFGRSSLVSIRAPSSADLRKVARA